VVVAQAILKQDNLQSKVVPAGFCTQQNIVCSQSPAGGHLLPGKTVTLFTAPTSTPTTTLVTTPVPNVATFTTTQACNAIAAAHFQCGNISMTPSSQPVGTVVSTNPAQGTLEPANTSINLIESSGPAQVIVPNVVGQTFSQASSNLQSSNLTVATNCSGGSGTSPAAGDPVTAQSTPGGNTVATGSQVTITVTCSGVGTTTTHP
jgi:serine/threonine-protein kinase